MAIRGAAASIEELARVPPAFSANIKSRMKPGWTACR